METQQPMRGNREDGYQRVAEPAPTVVLECGHTSTDGYKFGYSWPWNGVAWFCHECRHRRHRRKAKP